MGRDMGMKQKDKSSRKKELHRLHVSASVGQCLMLCCLTCSCMKGLYDEEA